MSDHPELHKALRDQMPADFPTERQVEAAARAWCEANGHFFDSCPWDEQHIDHARMALVAAAKAQRD